MAGLPDDHEKEFSSLPSHLNYAAPTQALPCGTKCILVDNVPLEYTADEISGALLDTAVSDVRVIPNISGGIASSPSKNYALASVAGATEGKIGYIHRLH